MKEKMKKPRILCVDDEKAVLEGLMDQLHREFDITLASSGAQALEILSKGEPYSVVLSDMRMPGMSGTELLSQVRTQSPETVRVLLTGYTDTQSAVDAVNHGQVFRFLTKPCPPPTLKSALQVAVEHHDSRLADRERLRNRIDGLCDQLVHAERLATLGTMAGTVAHEMNNVLAVLLSGLDYVEECAKQGVPAEEDVYRDLKRAKQHIKSHAANLLDLARPKAKEDAIVDLGEIIEATISMLRLAGITKHVSIDLTVPEDEVLVFVDRTRIEQIVVNLVKNAIDALDPKDDASRVEIAVQSQNDFITVDVTDNGCGISPENLENVFASYFSEKQRDVGTGLGLPVVKQILEEYGGSIVVTSRVNEGTTFRFSLPRPEKSCPVAPESWMVQA